MNGPMPCVWYPFRLVLKPYFAPEWIAFLLALGPALLVMTAHYLWVMRADVAFEEASVEAARRLAERVAAVRSGNLRTASQKLKPKRAPFTLHIWIVVLVATLVLAFALRGVPTNTH